MLYTETQVPAYFSKHIESYWEMRILPGELEHLAEGLLPTCTFNIIFTSQACLMEAKGCKYSQHILPGASFIGQRNRPISFSVTEPTYIYGVRFKPFAFSHLIKTPLYQLTDQCMRLDQVFDLKPSIETQIPQIIRAKELEQRAELLNRFLLALFGDSWMIDQPLRAQLNYILDRKGILKINHLFSEFGISKVTLRKHFIEKVGLTPKQVSRIWRMNYFFLLRESMPEESLTNLSLMADFYDQAHFNREFKSLFSCTPRSFFQADSQLVSISQQSISRRFGRQYDPRE